MLQLAEESLLPRGVHRSTAEKGGNQGELLPKYPRPGGVGAGWPEAQQDDVPDVLLRCKRIDAAMRWKSHVMRAPASWGDAAKQRNVQETVLAEENGRRGVKGAPASRSRFDADLALH